jgi:heat-inducible transcriptional repressor
MLSERQTLVLELVIRQYVETAEPVGSRNVAERHALDVSSATVRAEMKELEGQGYLTHPHTSSGRVPTDKGYRFYVETLMREEEVPREVQRTIRHQFHQVEHGQEAWVHLAASVLAQAVENAAVVTAPRTEACRLKHVELVHLNDRTVLLVIVLDRGRLKQQILSLNDDVTQDELSAVSAKLNGAFAGSATVELTLEDIELTELERDVMDVVASTMLAIDEGGSDEAYLDGLRHVLKQPEFANSERALGLLELLDERTFVRVIPLHALAREGVTVIIGGANPRLASAGEAMRSCSVVVGAYGAPGVATGALAVLGPTRMDYSRTISTVRYLSNVMSELVLEQ